MGTHTRIELDAQTERILCQLWIYFNKWHASAAANRRFADWIHENLNHSSYEPAYPSAEKIQKMNHFDDSGNWQPRREHQLHNEDCALSLEIVIGWSAFRISLAVLLPVTLSMVIGIWYQKATGDVATAWVLATYVVTTAGSKYYCSFCEQLLIASSNCSIACTINWSRKQNIKWSKTHSSQGSTISFFPPVSPLLILSNTPCTAPNPPLTFSIRLGIMHPFFNPCGMYFSNNHFANSLRLEEKAFR